MSWKRVWFKKGKAYAKFGEDGSLELEDGRAQIRYKPDDTRVYLASPANVKPIDDAQEVPSEQLQTKPAKLRQSQSTRTVKIDKAEIEIWTDGACSGNPGDAGAGALLRFGEHSLEISRYLGRATNNIAELQAIKIALEAMRDPKRSIRLHTDSSYALGVLTKGWKAKKNPELVAEIRELLKRFPKLEIAKVAGHAGIEENEKADELARMAVVSRSDSEERH